jgi:hypothetical protein
VGRRLTVFVAIAGATALAAAAAAPAAAPPRVKEMHYFVRDDGLLPHTVLKADVKRADRVRVAVVFRGKHASAPTRHDDGITWELQHKHRGGKVYKLIRRSLHRRGSASVRIRARNPAGTDHVKLKIRESECSMDPPFYPLDCTIHR